MLSVNLKLFMIFGDASKEAVLTFSGLFLSSSEIYEPFEPLFYTLTGEVGAKLLSSRVCLKFYLILKMFLAQGILLCKRHIIDMTISELTSLFILS